MRAYPEPSCAADLNGNYFVEVNDLLGMLTGFGARVDAQATSTVTGPVPSPTC